MRPNFDNMTKREEQQAQAVFNNLLGRMYAARQRKIVMEAQRKIESEVQDEFNSQAE